MGLYLPVLDTLDKSDRNGIAFGTLVYLSASEECLVCSDFTDTVRLNKPYGMK